HPWTHPTLMPPMTHMGPAAPAGLHRYESDQFGKEYANNLFCCQFNLRKVSRHVLVPKGSTYETKDSDFVVSDNIDFHPTDVIEDADGSLLIVDTGGWYKLCCPTSQLVKPDVTGAIYRVRKTGAHKVDDPRGLKIDWKKLDEAALGKLLHDPRPAVRQRAVTTAENSATLSPYDVAVAGLTADATEHGTLAATWLLAREWLRGWLALPAAVTHSPREDVRKAALHVLAIWGPLDDTNTSQVQKRLTDKSPAVRRTAAMAIGRMKRFQSVPHVLAALSDEQNDRVLDHALTYALIEIGHAKETAEGLSHKSPQVRRACLAALANIPDSGLEANAVLRELDSPDAALRETAWWVAGRHPQWGDRLAGYFTEKLKSADKLKPEERDELADRLAKFAKSEAIQKVIGAATADPAAAPVALRVMARSGLKDLPPAWRDGLLAAAPKLADREAYRAALAVFRAVPAGEKDFDAFVATAPRAVLWPAGVVPDEFKLATLAARPAGLPLGVSATRYLLGKLDRDQPAADRSVAADALARAKLSSEQLADAAAALKAANPLDLVKLLPVFEKSKDEKVGLALVAALRDKAVRPAVRVEVVKPMLDKYPKAVQAEAEKLYAELAEARKDERARLEKILAELKPGDVRRGQVVFNNAKAQCIACHKVGYVGGTVGPDLTRIGGIRTERDL
ncbi:MAG TPA: HEAT repeat domain-containing protein, partial [Gemmata sp.]|nr:HEAT repeat domain-containing protein [Gemmata sp.]